MGSDNIFSSLTEMQC